MQLDPKGLAAAVEAHNAVVFTTDEDHTARIVAAYLEAAPSPSPAPGVVELDDDQIMEIVKKVAPWKDEPKFNDLLTYEKSVPLFPQATYDVPSYRAVKFVRAVERALASLSQPAKGEREGGGRDD